MLKTQICVTRPQCVKIFPLLARDSTLNIPNKILLYKLLLRSMITYAAPVWSSTSPTNYRHLQVYQSKCLHVIGDLPRRTPISNLHGHLQIIPIHQFIYHITDKFFVSCPMHPNASNTYCSNCHLPLCFSVFSSYCNDNFSLL